MSEKTSVAPVGQKKVESQDLRGQALAWGACARWKLAACIMEGRVHVQNVETKQWEPFDAERMLAAVIHDTVRVMLVPDELGTTPSGHPEFIQGFALAVAVMHKNHGETGMCAEALAAAGYTLAEFRAAGVEEYDMEEIRKIFAGSPSLRRRTARGGSGG